MRFFPLLLLLTVGLAGCFSSSAASPRHGPDLLSWGILGPSDVPTLDPALASDPTSIGIASLVYGGLVRLDKHLHVQPDGASHWTISRDGLTYTFFLRPNLRFADGRSVTALDFARALNRALGPEGASGTASVYLGGIVHRSAIVRGTTRTTRGITVLNPRTLRITLAQPAAHFLSELAFPASFVPEPALEQDYGPDWTDHAAGFGPYYVQVWRHSRYLTLQRNPHYYGGKPSVQRITIHFYGSEGSALAAYGRGNLDLVSGFQPGQALPTQVAGIRRIPALALDYLAFNATRTPFRHLNVRRAFAAAVSPALVARAMGHTAFASHSFLPSAFGIQVPPWQTKRTPATYLAKAHYPQGQSFPNVVLVMPRDAHLSALGHALQHRWTQQLGLMVQLRPLNSVNYGAVLDAHTFDLALVRWGADYPDPQDFLGTQLGSSSNNVTGWAGRVYDDDVLLADSYQPRDPRRPQLFRQAALLAERRLPLLPLDEPAETALIQPRLAGIDLTALGTIYGDWPHVRYQS